MDLVSELKRGVDLYFPEKTVPTFKKIFNEKHSMNDVYMLIGVLSILGALSSFLLANMSRASFLGGMYGALGAVVSPINMAITSLVTTAVGSFVFMYAMDYLGKTQAKWKHKMSEFFYPLLVLSLPVSALNLVFSLVPGLSIIPGILGLYGLFLTHKYVTEVLGVSDTGKAVIVWLGGMIVGAVGGGIVSAIISSFLPSSSLPRYGGMGGGFYPPYGHY